MHAAFSQFRRTFLKGLALSPFAAGPALAAMPLATGKKSDVAKLIEAHKASVAALHQSVDAQDAAVRLKWDAKSETEKAHAQERAKSADLENREALAVEGQSTLALLEAVPTSADEAQAKAEYLTWLYREGRNGPLEDDHLDALLRSIERAFSVKRCGTACSLKCADQHAGGLI
jgi:hypothetical protein